jgi:hypothetical protein
MLKDLRCRYVEKISSCSYLGILVFAIYTYQYKTSVISFFLVAIVSILAWFASYRRSNTIADIATSRIGSAAQGYVELYGLASVNLENLIISPLSGISCIWFRYKVYSKDNSDREWREVSSNVSETTFEISDGTGKCQVDPDFAEVISPDKKVSYHGIYKHVEELLFAGGNIYVLGEFSTIGGASSVLSMRDDVRDLLAEWKKDPTQLKNRFDLGGNGEIDVLEWEQARQAAIKEVEKLHQEIRAESAVNVIRAPKDHRLFLISSMSPQKLRQRYQLWSYFHLVVLGLVISVFFWSKLNKY